jgi:hypothetical protein
MVISFMIRRIRKPGWLPTEHGDHAEGQDAERTGDAHERGGDAAESEPDHAQQGGRGARHLRIVRHREGGRWGCGDRNAAGEGEQRHDDHPQRHRSKTRREHAEGAERGHGDPHGQGAENAPPFCGAPGEVAGHHVTGGVQPERGGVPLR